MSADLKVENLKKAFGAGRPAIDDVSFSVPAGEIIVLLGPSGCGKTTTLRCVAGLEHPSSGVISIGDQVVSDPARGILTPPRARHIGMVFQSYAVWPHMTVRQNVAYPLKHRKVGRAEAEEAIAKALHTVGLTDYGDRSVSALSGGQMQRVALARSLVYSPRLLLLDEPLSNLDAKLRLRLRDDLRRIIKAAGITALYVTHDQSEAIALADRIGVMRDGKLLQLGTAQELYDRPADLFVANFTGATNVLEGKLISVGVGKAMVALNSGDELAVAASPGCAKGDEVKVAARPENLVLDAPGVTGGNILPGVVIERQYQGVQTFYRLQVGMDVLEAVELGSAPRHEPGATVSVLLPPEGCWAYPASAA